MQSPKGFQKSEWKGASVRNPRVNCNVILPFVSNKSSKVHWLHWLNAKLLFRTFLILGLVGSCLQLCAMYVFSCFEWLEPLNWDCGGGLLSSNVSLLFHQLSLADMFTKDAEIDSHETVKHVRTLRVSSFSTMARTMSIAFMRRGWQLMPTIDC